MNINELDKLAKWFIDHFANLNNLYSNVLSPVQYNANQASKQAIEDQLNSLINYLNDMRFDELSLEQIKLLQNFGVEKYIGTDGANFIESTIRVSDYDPTTAANRIGEAISKLNQAHSAFTSYRQSLDSLKIPTIVPEYEIETITIRVGFRNDASINNVTDWKDSAKEWYDIIRGLALASNEAPEDTRVIGASSGSIILILAATLSVTTLLALISKNISSVAKDVIDIGNQRERLRQNKLLNRVIETELNKIEKQKKDQALGEIMSMITKNIGEIDGEQTNAIEVSIKKLLDFSEKGGDVDFVAADAEAADEETTDGNADEPQTALAQTVAAIREYQAVREQVKLLSDLTGQ